MNAPLGEKVFSYTALCFSFLISALLSSVLLVDMYRSVQVGFLRAEALIAKAAGADESVFTQEDLVALIKPTVVRVVHQIDGTYTIPNFRIDPEKMAVEFLPGLIPAPVKKISTGSGIVVSPDGYILTNAHVALDTVPKYTEVSDIVFTYGYRLERLARSSGARIPAEDVWDAFLEKVTGDVIKRTTFSGSRTLSVARPLSLGDAFEEILRDALPATLVKGNDNFINDYRDAALIKIDAANLPAIAIRSDVRALVGSSLYAFGFPSAAEVSQDLAVESTVTRGVVSALRLAPFENFKGYQTDAKTSSGSSGGPVLTERGAFLGLVTAISGDDYYTVGDTFTFVVPVEVIAETLGADLPLGEVSPYESSFREAVSLLHARQCEAALEAFGRARAVDSRFSVAAYVAPYEKQCALLIDQGESIDSAWDSVRARARSASTSAILGVSFASVAALGLAAMVLIFSRRMRESERMIAILQEKLKDVPPPSVSPRAFAPSGALNVLGVSQLAGYVKQARAAEISDHSIRAELTHAGWLRDQIDAAFAVI